MWKACQQSCGVGETKVANGIFSPEFLSCAPCSLACRFTLLSLSSFQQSRCGSKLNGLERECSYTDLVHNALYPVFYLFYTLQTWNLNCKDTNLSVSMFVSLCVLNVRVRRHKRKFPETPHCC